MSEQATACKKHKDAPVKGYSQCAGCEIEALRAENGRLESAWNVATLRRKDQIIATQEAENDRVKQELAAARGLLRELYNTMAEYFPGDNPPAHEGLMARAAAALTATPAPEAQTEQGERQEAVAWLIDWPEEPELGHYFSDDPNPTARSRPLYTIPQPAPDVHGLVSFALELIKGAWEGGSFDGGDIQDAGVRHGLLVVEQREESCGDHCSCAEHGFPIECYRLKPAMAAYRAKGGE